MVSDGLASRSESMFQKSYQLILILTDKLVSKGGPALINV